MHATKLRLIRCALAVAAILALPTLTVVPLNALAQPSAATASYSHSKLNRLVRNAHTPAQYQVLAVYFRSQERIFRSRAAAEKVEWERRQAVVTGPQFKFPTPADSARNLYEYYTDKADEMARRAADYEQRAR